ncbi:MAG: helix-turn-helix transcriptional regulator [Actinobacteria bacterium]|nr:helix-turn-helix transcriptional regulator [Actinomycetota bacterium]
MQNYSVGEAARRLGISIDTLRRWDRQGRIRTERDAANRRLVPVGEVERLRGTSEHALSARNRLAGTVRDVKVEGLLAQIEIEAGPFRIVSVITSEAAEQLGLEPGVPATALVKATSVLIER